jgi:hypothetical protein
VATLIPLYSLQWESFSDLDIICCEFGLAEELPFNQKDRYYQPEYNNCDVCEYVKLFANILHFDGEPLRANVCSTAESRGAEGDSKRPPPPGWRTPERGQGKYESQAQRSLQPPGPLSVN